MRTQTERIRFVNVVNIETIRELSKQPIEEVATYLCEIFPRGFNEHDIPLEDNPNEEPASTPCQHLLNCAENIRDTVLMEHSSTMEDVQFCYVLIQYALKLREQQGYSSPNTNVLPSYSSSIDNDPKGWLASYYIELTSMLRQISQGNLDPSDNIQEYLRSTETQIYNCKRLFGEK